MYLADCIGQICDWDLLCDTEEYGRFLEALHVMKRHPEQFRELLPKAPALEDYERKLHDSFGKEAMAKFLADV